MAWQMLPTQRMIFFWRRVDIHAQGHRSVFSLKPPSDYSLINVHRKMEKFGRDQGRSKILLQADS